MIVLCSSGTDLDAKPSPVFGRCPYFLFIDDETDEVTASANPAMDASGGAGVQVAQFVIDGKAEAVLSGRVGPHALDVLSQAGIRVYDMGGADARTAVSRFRSGELSELTPPATPRPEGG